MPLRLISRYALALLFIVAGVNHFIHTDTSIYLKIMPPQLPAPLALVYVSGVCEVLGGIGLLMPATRQLAGWGLLALLAAVFPANVYMALHYAELGFPAWLAWGRLPLQLPLLWWVWRVMNNKSPTKAGLLLFLAANWSTRNFYSRTSLRVREPLGLSRRRR